jgi:DNA helicase MCM9
MLESIVRLSQAHAKLMHRKSVEVMDVVVAITLIECSSYDTCSTNRAIFASCTVWNVS